MRKINLAVIFNERNFAVKFAESMAAYFNISVYENIDEAGIEAADLFISDIQETDADVYIVWDKNKEDDLHIYAFSGIEGMRKKIAYAYGILKGSTGCVISSLDTEVITVCSHRGGAGTTIFAMTLSEKLRGKTIYLSLEDIPYEEKKDTPMDINRFMYELNDSFDHADTDWVTYEGSGGTEYINYRDPYNLINLIDTDELRKLFVKLSGRYDYIVADTGCRVSPVSEEILKLSSKVYYIVPDGESGYKRERYEKFLRGTGCEVREIVNFCDVAYSEDEGLLSEDIYKLRRINGSNRELKEYMEDKCEKIIDG